MENTILIKKSIIYHNNISRTPRSIRYIKNGIRPTISTNFKKYLIVKKATNAEITKPKTSSNLNRLRFDAIESPIKKTNAPKIVGIASKKENFEASLKFKPKNKPAIMTTPDLEAPGINAKI